MRPVGSHYRIGFTLIELSIVLVIIGLVAAGILYGKDLIRAAEIRRLISQKNSFDIAANTFLNKYNCIAGDCDKAQEIGIGTSPGNYGENGNNDDIINYRNAAEAQNFWYHLSKAGMISWAADSSAPYNSQVACRISAGSYETSPCLVSGDTSSGGYMGGWWIYDTNDIDNITVSPPSGIQSGARYFWLSFGVALGLESTVFIPADAYAIDSKIDDGFPNSGFVVAGADAQDSNPLFGPTDPYTGAAGATNDNCATTETPSRYNYLNVKRTPTNMCSLLIKTNF